LDRLPDPENRDNLAPSRSGSDRPTPLPLTSTERSNSAGRTATG
ncbi:MAG: hypothetical protein QOF00_6353, partial [Pseudonocardiales bacterium]|nr:hypothetical protein [Pseudonocardiales bacterium]